MMVLLTSLHIQNGNMYMIHVNSGQFSFLSKLDDDDSVCHIPYRFLVENQNMKLCFELSAPIHPSFCFQVRLPFKNKDVLIGGIKRVKSIKAEIEW